MQFLIDNIYYVGEVKQLTVPEIAKQFPHLTEEQLTKIQQSKGYSNQQLYGWQTYDPNTVQVLFFEYKTYNSQVFKIKETDTGLEKALENPVILPTIDSMRLLYNLGAHIA